MRSPKRFGFWVSVGLGLILLFVWEQVRATQLGYRVEAARAILEAQEHKNAYLRLELERWKSPGHLQESARKRLGMQPASPSTIVLLPAPPQETPSRFWVRLISKLSPDS